jgi:hypothetical protein
MEKESRPSTEEPSHKSAWRRKFKRTLAAPYPFRLHIALVALMAVAIGGGAHLIGRIYIDRSYGGFAVFVFSLLGSMIVTALLSSRTKMVLPDGAILAIFFGVMLGIVVPPLQRLGAAPRLHQTSPGELPYAPEASVFTFREGTQALDFSSFLYVTVESTDSKGKKTTSKKLYAVAPLVGPGWTREQEVPAWSTCESPTVAHDVCEQQFRTPVRAGIVNPVQDPDFLKAIAKAEEQHGLRSRVGARLVELVPDAEQAIRGKWRTLVMVTLIVCALWAVIISVLWAWQTLRQRRLGTR